MQDRIPLYPGRVTLTPVSGQENTYDMVRADQPTQEGTPLNKANLLTDDTAAQYGLEGVVPNDIFSWLGKYNEHWWSLLHGEAYSYYQEKTELLSNSISKAYVALSSSSGSLKYSYSLTISSTGGVSLADPIEIDGYASKAATALTYAANIAALAETQPVYLEYGSSATIVKIPVGATANTKSSTTASATFGVTSVYDGQYNVILFMSPTSGSIPLAVSSELVQVPAGETTYEHSTDRNAYPDSGTVDGITYSYLGVPFEKFPTVPQIETGTYTGAGVYGEANPNTLTFDFRPKIVIVSGSNMQVTSTDQTTRTTSAFFIALWGKSYSSNPDGLSRQQMSFSDKTMTWYTAYSSANSGSHQFNYANETYYYVAIG